MTFRLISEMKRDYMSGWPEKKVIKQERTYNDSSSLNEETSEVERYFAVRSEGDTE